MDGLKTYIAVLTERYGSIENMKFLLGFRSGLTKQLVDAELLKVADAIKAGKCIPSSKFPEPGLNNSPIKDLKAHFSK